MPNYNYSLNDGAGLNEEQTQFLVDIWPIIVNVEFAPFGDLTAWNAFLAEVEKIDEVFGEGAVEASSDVNTSGWMHFDSKTRDILSLIHNLVNMKNSKSLGSFMVDANFFDNQAEVLVEYIQKYDIEEY